VTCSASAKLQEQIEAASINSLNFSCIWYISLNCSSLHTVTSVLTIIKPLDHLLEPFQQDAQRIAWTIPLPHANSRPTYCLVGNIWRTIFLKYDHAITINIRGKDTPRTNKKVRTSLRVT
jgi:hypothetical protein